MWVQLVLLNLIELFWREGPSADMVLRPVMEVTCSDGLIDFIEGSRYRLPCPTDDNGLSYVWEYAYCNRRPGTEVGGKEPS